jgi:periplasmic protein TonB
MTVLSAAQHPDSAKSKKEQDNDDEPVYSLTNDITPPRVTKQVPPDYSPGARGIKIHGSVLVETVVTSRGLPRNTRVIKGLDKDIDEAVVAAVKQWQFAPAKKDGKPVAVRVQLEIAFHSM